jgi:nitroreductase
MKKFMILTFAMMGAVWAGAPQAGAQDESAYDLILHNFGARDYVAGRIPKSDLDKIVGAGARAPSAMNKQPWKFIVVQDAKIISKIIAGMPDGNVLIIVTSTGNNKEDADAALNCALATENMYLAAQALGYGSRIYTGPIDAVNSGLKTELGIASNESAYTIIRVGRLGAGVDAVSKASPRKNLSDVVRYK